MKDAIHRLRSAYQNDNLTLYLGAGVSVANGLPSWDKLVLAMYFSAINRQGVDEALRPFPNYLFAIAEWHLERRREPLDITARKIRNFYDSQNIFLEKLQQTLYAGFMQSGTRRIQTPKIKSLLDANPTLAAIVRLCTKPGSRRSHIRSVITYNYDNLLELALRNMPVRSIWNADEDLNRYELPIYHVHGFIPIEGLGSDPQEIVFTEEQYYLAAQNAYSWNNLVQIKYLSSSVGLMIGLSLTDRNMRRLLDAVKETPVRSDNFVLLQEPRWPKPDTDEVKRIDKKANEYYDKFKKSGVKADERRYDEIVQIIKDVEKRDLKEQQTILRQLGVTPIWYREHSEIPAIIESIMGN